MTASPGARLARTAPTQHAEHIEHIEHAGHALHAGRTARTARAAPATCLTPALLAIALLAMLALPGCDTAPADTLSGYAEGEYVQVASPYGGTLQRLAVARGQQVEAGATLFQLERAVEQGAADAAQARVGAVQARANAAQARIANLVTARRKAELDVVRAQTDNARAALALARTQLEQQQQLFASGFVSQAVLDAARANYDRSAAAEAEAQAQYRVALQSLGRGAEIDAARAELEAARAELEAARADLAQAGARLDQKTGVAPAAGLVQDVYYREGEWVAAGSPVLSLLPPANIKARFFVPERVVGTLRVGQPVRLACDGCGEPIAASITYVSPQAEYTPPVIYSRESRSKLVFLVEARPGPADATRLHPGQPLDVTLD